MRHVMTILFALLWMLPARAQNTNVIFWHHFPDDRAEFWDTLAAEFNDTHDVQVTVQYFPSYSHQHEAILSALVNGGLPDAALIRGYDTALYQLSDSLVDLAEFSEINAEDFYPAFWDRDSFAGQQLGIPLTRAAAALYVNMDALRELGYSAPPTTRAELGEIACAFHAANGWDAVQSVNAAGLDIPLDASFYLVQAETFYQNQMFDFAQPGLRQTIVDMQSWLGQGCAALRLDGGQALLQSRFASGQTLFYMDSSAARPYVEAAIGDFFAEPFELSLVPLPGNDRAAAYWGGSSMSIFRSAPEHEAAAWEWVRWLAEPAQVERWAAENAAFPARQDVDVPDEYAPFVDAVWHTEPNLPGFDLVRDEVVFTARGILAGGDAEAGLGDLTDTANAILAAFAPE